MEMGGEIFKNPQSSPYYSAPKRISGPQYGDT